MAGVVWDGTIYFKGLYFGKMIGGIFCLNKIPYICNRLPNYNTMSEKELNSYRFSPFQEPTDEMLSQIMKEVAEEARISNRRATEAYLAAMLRDIAIKQARWAEQINRVVHGRG